MSSDEFIYTQASDNAETQLKTTSITNSKLNELPPPINSPNFKFKSLSSFHKHYSTNLCEETLFNVKSLPSNLSNKLKNGINLPTTEWSKFLQFIKLERSKNPSSPSSTVIELTNQLIKEPVTNLKELLPLVSQLFDNNPTSSWLKQNFKIFSILVKNSSNYQKNLEIRIIILNIIKPFIINDNSNRNSNEEEEEEEEEQGDYINELILFLNSFSNSGRNVNGLEIYLFTWLYNYLTYYYLKGQNLSNSNIKSILKYIGQLIKFNFSLFSPLELTKLIKSVELITNWKELDEEGGNILINIFDTLVRFGYLPSECISSFCTLMTHLYSNKKWRLAAWGIVKNILRSHCATSVICSFFDMAHNIEEDLNIVKYAMGAIGESLWGLDRIEPQVYPTFSALEHFSKLLKDSKFMPNSHIRIATILQQLNKLIINRKINLSPADWEIIIDMVCQTAYLIKELNLNELKPSALGIESTMEFEEDSTTELWVRFNQLVTTISPTLTSLHVNEIQKFIFILKDRWDDLSEPLLLGALEYLSSSNVFLPSRSNWNDSLKDLLNRFFITKSLKAKETILEILERSFISCSFSNQQTFIDIFIEEIGEKLLELDNGSESGIILKVYKLMVKFWDLDLDDFTPLFQLLLKPFNSIQDTDINAQSQVIHHQMYNCFILSHWFSLALIGRSKYCTNLYSILYEIASNTQLEPEPRLMAYTSLFNVFTDNSNSPYFGQLSLNEKEVVQCLELIQDCKNLPNSKLSNYWVFNGLSVLNIWNNEENYNQTTMESKFANHSTPNTKKFPPSPIDLSSTGAFTLSTQLFLSNIINSLTEEIEWGIMAYILYQTPAYLDNHLDHLNHRYNILNLRTKLCNLISSGSFGSKIKGIPQHIKKGSLYSSIYRLIDSIIPYKQLFNKSEKDEIVSAYHVGLSRWSNTSIQCIHSLTLCCVEYPMSLTRLLPTILLKLSQIMSTSTISIHILEFLSTLVTLPDLYSNFVEDDFKRVLGISIQYIQYHMGNNQLNQNQNQVCLQYVLMMAYMVISIWLTIIRSSDQPKYVPFLVRGLLLANKGRSSLDEQTITCLDMISRYSFCDSDSVLPCWDLVKDKLFTKEAMLGQSSYWVFGDTIIQVNLSRTGFGEVKIRSSSALTTLVKKISDYNIDLSKPSESDETNQDEPIPKININDTNYLTVHQSILRDAIAQYKGPGELMPPKADISPLPRPKLHQITQPDEGILRGISVLDRMPTVDFHKIGVVYAGPGQTDEKEILANSMGSKNYQRILHNLGNLVRLKQLKGTYTGGLDTEMDLDGKYAYSWSDGLTQLIFHAATLMPTRLKYDPQCNAKKRHIGNDYVSIVYNDSGLDYKFNTLPGQFNLVNIIITPIFESKQESQPSEDFCSPNLENFTPSCNEMFRIETQFRSDINHLSPLVNAKVVSGPSVAPLIRQVALNCSIFTQIYLKPKDYTTNWTERYKQINRIKERVVNQPLSPTT